MVATIVCSVAALASGRPPHSPASSGVIAPQAVVVPLRATESRVWPEVDDLGQTVLGRLDVVVKAVGSLVPSPTPPDPGPHSKVAVPIQPVVRQPSRPSLRPSLRPHARPPSPRPRATAPRAPPPTLRAPVVSRPVSDDVWARLRHCESSGDYTKNTGNGFYGAFQFLPSTWNRIARIVNRPDLVGVLPHLASPGDQDMMAQSNQRISGFRSQWPVCSRRLGLS